MRCLNETSHHSLWYSKGSACSLVGYSDSNFEECKSDRKSTSGTSHLFGRFLVSLYNKKKHSVSLSTSEAEYVSGGSYFAQVLWLKKQLLDCDLKLGCVLTNHDNTSVINLTKNPVHDLPGGLPPRSRC